MHEFFSEWGGLISFGLIVILIMVICGWYRSSKRYKKDLADRRESYDSLFERYKIYRNVVNCLTIAIDGSQHVDFTQLFKKLEENIDREFWLEIIGGPGLNPEWIEEYITLIYNLRSAMNIFERIRDGCISGYHLYDQRPLSYDVTALANEYFKRINQTAKHLHLLGLDALKSHLIHAVTKAIKPFIATGHANQAKYLLENMNLGTDRVDMNMAVQFVKHCDAGSVEPFSLIDSKNPLQDAENLTKILKAVEFINQQAEQPAKEKVDENKS